MFPWNFFPNNHEMKNKLSQLKPEQIERFTQDIINKVMPKQAQGMVDPQDMLKSFFPANHNHSTSESSSTLQTTIFETHDFVYIRIFIEEKDWLNSIKIYFTSNQMIIEHIPTFEDKHTLSLPASVKKKGATASFQDGTLELKLAKSTHTHYSEIDVSELK
jgi:HSP20 family molecular chaperone IbpA